VATEAGFGGAGAAGAAAGTGGGTATGAGTAAGAAGATGAGAGVGDDGAGEVGTARSIAGAGSGAGAGINGRRSAGPGATAAGAGEAATAGVGGVARLWTAGTMAVGAADSAALATRGAGLLGQRPLRRSRQTAGLRFPATELDMWKQPSTTNLQPAADQTAPNTPRPAVEVKRPASASIGRSIIIKGDVIGSEDLAIDGQVEGRVELRGHSLLLGPNANIRAQIVARVVTIMGTVVGNITATDTVDVRGSGSVDGNINARRIIIADGAEVRGRIDTLSAKEEQLEPLDIAV
jgi:cytoskeletal protein CcmA (bactofilin family)